MAAAVQLIDLAASGDKMLANLGQIMPRADERELSPC
jgi:hypothetical protein